MGKPAITGPSFYNFTDITEQLQSADAVWICADAQELGQMLTQLFANSAQCEAMGAAALNVVKQNQGAVAKTLTALNHQLSIQAPA